MPTLDVTPQPVDVNGSDMVYSFPRLRGSIVDVPEDARVFIELDYGQGAVTLDGQPDFYTGVFPAVTADGTGTSAAYEVLPPEIQPDIDYAVSVRAVLRDHESGWEVASDWSAPLTFTWKSPPPPAVTQLLLLNGATGEATAAPRR